MSSIINNFNIFRDLPPSIIQNIKSFFVCGLNGYCVTNDDKVYGFATNIHKTLGYKKNDDDNNYVEIVELNDQNIEVFLQGNNCMYARNSENKIFSWGYNYHGQLGREFKFKKVLRPKNIEFFDGKNIFHISYDRKFNLAISTNGTVYGWGKKKHKIQVIRKMYEIKHVKSILYTINQLDFLRLYVLNMGGSIYHICKVDNKNGNNFCYFMKKHSEICQIKDNIEKETKSTITDIFCAEKNKVIFQIKDSVCVSHNSKFETSACKSLFEYFLFERQETYTTIQIKDNQLSAISFEKNENSKQFSKKYKLIHSNDYSFKMDENSTLMNCRILNDLSSILDSNANYFYQTGNTHSTYFGFFVKNDNKVYAFGNNSEGNLGFGNNKRVFVYTEIEELFNQNIVEFYEGYNARFMFARNDKNEIFGWGRNESGQLGNGSRYKKHFLKPHRIPFFDGKNIIHISCGLKHCLALSSDGLLYGGGNNNFGQVGSGYEKDFITTPCLIDLKTPIIYIHSSDNMSFAVTADEKTYYWGHPSLKIEIIFKPRLLNVERVTKICNYNSNSFIVLDKTGKAFLYNYLNEKVNEIICEATFRDIYYDNNECLLQTEHCVFEFTKGEKPKKSNFINFYDFYSHKPKKYKKTIQITKDGYLMTNEIVYNETENILELQERNVFNMKYENIFKEINEIGKGGFGAVSKVMNNTNKNYYAIKRLEIKDELDLKEIQIMAKLNNDFVVQYIDSWIEGILAFRKIRKFLFIQMELCSQSLRELIEVMNQISDKRFQTFNYFISCELFKELIESVDYLHSRKPPIIHRDLKPENILISDGITGRFLKLCDFGLARLHEMSVHTKYVGTVKYMAPEVFISTNYNIKSDVYSLALIATEIFKFEDEFKIIRIHKSREHFDKYLTKYLNTNLETKFSQLLDTISNCLHPEDYHSRPDSKLLLEKLKVFSIDKTIVLKDDNISQFEILMDQQDNFMMKKFLILKFIELSNFFVSFNYF